tara:strand:- start:204 stop:332 length:129 start_codon:yes stop_codon:yes gene_type:complete
MTKLIWKLYTQEKITLRAVKEILFKYDRSKEKIIINPLNLKK